VDWLVPGIGRSDRGGKDVKNNDNPLSIRCFKVSPHAQHTRSTKTAHVHTAHKLSLLTYTYAHCTHFIDIHTCTYAHTTTYTSHTVYTARTISVAHISCEPQFHRVHNPGPNLVILT
jgi:hypothetical protein